MRYLYCFSASLTLALIVTLSPAPAQQTSGFGHKYKTTPANPDLARRLNAAVAPLPTGPDRTALLTAAPFTTPSLRLRVSRDSLTGRPLFIENLQPGTSANKAARVSATAAVTQFLSQTRGLLGLSNPASDFELGQSTTDELGQIHIRLQQTFRAVPIYGAELVAHLIDGAVTTLNGRPQAEPSVDFDISPALSAAQVASRARQDARQSTEVRSFGGQLLEMKDVENTDLCIYPTANGFRLAYELTVRPNWVERWHYVIDAQTGAVLSKMNHTCALDGPARASRPDLNGKTQTVQSYQVGTNYYLIDATRPMFNAGTSKLPGNPAGAVWTVDAKNVDANQNSFDIYQITSGTNATWTPTAVSAHYNGGIAYDYYRNTFGRNSLNGGGGTMISVINMADKSGKGLDNAFWNGKFIAYGNGNVAFKPLAGGLDVAGHEMTHGVVENTARLEYRSQSGALNESLADVFGVLIDRNNWTIGEDIVLAKYFPSGALRSMSNPNQGGKSDNGYQPKQMSEYENLPETEDGDNGGVHINSGIPNWAFYKFATAIGKDKAEKIYYRTMTNYLVRTSQFIDMRLGVIKAAGDLYGATGAEVTAAKAAFDAVGITDTGTPAPSPSKPDLPTANGQDLILLTDTESTAGQLYGTTVGATTFARKSTSKLTHRPSVTDDGKFAYFVGSDGKIRAVDLTTATLPTEQIVSQETGWDNVAISKDGTKLAALTNQADASVWVYSFDRKQWKQFPLYNPTSASGVTTGEVSYADSFEWDYTGEYLVYDAFNKLKNTSGQDVGYWDVGFIRVWDNSTKNFTTTGRINKLFSNLDDGDNIGNPSYARNSPDILAFDYFSDNDNTYYVLGVDVTKGTLKEIYKNNTTGYPSYSRQDNRMVFGTLGTGNKENIGVINLGTDKISPSGGASTLYTGAKWPVWYTQGSRVIAQKAAQTITFPAIADRTLADGSFTLAATASSGLAVSFALVSGPGTLSGNRVTPTAGGQIVVRASQAGDNTYAAASPVDQTIRIQVPLAVEPANWAETLTVLPNPVGTILTVELPVGGRISTLSLTTLTGQSAGRWQPAGSPARASVDINQLPPGFYLLTIETPTGMARRKIIKE